MREDLRTSDECFIAERQNYIRECMERKKELKKQLAEVMGEIRYVETDIQNARYSIRRKLGRENNEN